MSPDAIELRLKTIFSAVLEQPEAAVTDALSPETCAKWDSLNQIHLVNAIEEEFGISLDFDAQLELMSFAAAKDLVARALG
jgi:acyl carrier protein